MATYSAPQRYGAKAQANEARTNSDDQLPPPFSSLHMGWEPTMGRQKRTTACHAHAWLTDEPSPSPRPVGVYHHRLSLCLALAVTPVGRSRCAAGGLGLGAHGELELPHGQRRQGQRVLLLRTLLGRGERRGRWRRRGAVPGTEVAAGARGAVPADVGHVLHVRREADHHLPLLLLLLVVHREDLRQVLEPPQEPRHQRLPLAPRRRRRRPCFSPCHSRRNSSVTVVGRRKNGNGTELRAAQLTRARTYLAGGASCRRRRGARCRRRRRWSGSGSRRRRGWR
uniref:Uncharacterized protein n=1 Tax=Zea mays TaxID=4577 RepID=C0HE35_MAIZE|nr:unknown [Zea mays]